MDDVAAANSEQVHILRRPDSVRSQPSPRKNYLSSPSSYGFTAAQTASPAHGRYQRLSSDEEANHGLPVWMNPRFVKEKELAARRKEVWKQFSNRGRRTIRMRVSATTVDGQTQNEQVTDAERTANRSSRSSKSSRRAGDGLPQLKFTADSTPWHRQPQWLDDTASFNTKIDDVTQAIKASAHNYVYLSHLLEKSVPQGIQAPNVLDITLARDQYQRRYGRAPLPAETIREIERLKKERPDWQVGIKLDQVIEIPKYDSFTDPYCQYAVTPNFLRVVRRMRPEALHPAVEEALTARVGEYADQQQRIKTWKQKRDKQMRIWGEARGWFRPRPKRKSPRNATSGMTNNIDWSFLVIVGDETF